MVSAYKLICEGQRGGGEGLKGGGGVRRRTQREYIGRLCVEVGRGIKHSLLWMPHYASLHERVFEMQTTVLHYFFNVLSFYYS
jgi:hypothetical protein